MHIAMQQLIYYGGGGTTKSHTNNGIIPKMYKVSNLYSKLHSCPDKLCTVLIYSAIQDGD